MHKTSSFILIFLDVTLFAVCIFQLSKHRWRRRLQHLYPLCHPYTPISNTFGPRTSILQLTRLPLVQPTRKCPLLLSLRPLHPRHLLVLVDCPSLTVLWLEPKTELMRIWKRIDFSNKTTTITTTKKEFTKHFLFFPFTFLIYFFKVPWLAGHVGTIGRLIRTLLSFSLSLSFLPPCLDYISYNL